MAFMLSNVVPWGRTLGEYVEMFQLTELDLSKRIIGFGDGPASFNYEATQAGYNVTSLDIIYQFTQEQIADRIQETRDIVLQQTKDNAENFKWTKIKNLQELEKIRMGAMQLFLKDYEHGKQEKRYIYHELPTKTQFEDREFDIGLSSHFLLMYTNLGLDFHVKSIDEMLRICKEIRITPIVDLDGKPSELTKRIIHHYEKEYYVTIEVTNYEFLLKANQMLKICNI
ncbi:MAG: hypothetical protein ACRC7V_01820 [Lachnospiraceae bacterium]